MVKAETIQTFFKVTHIAIIGVSHNEKHFSNIVYKTMKEKGYGVIPVNPNNDIVLGDICYPGLKSLPVKVESAVILTAPKHTDAIVKEAIDYGIKNLWIQQKSETKAAIEMAEKNNINVVHHQCIFMFTEPVTKFHKFHKSVKKLFGQLPR